MSKTPHRRKPQSISASTSPANPSIDSLPLHALLSFALVAFTIELDNQFEQRVPHRTTVGKSEGAQPDSPWLVSLPMYANFLRFIYGDEALTISQFKQRANLSREVTRMWLTRLSSWWGYISVERSPTAAGPADWIIHLTRGGRRACETWQTLLPEIEANWGQRFGGKLTSRLRQALLSVRGKIPGEFPEHLPILGYGFVANFSPNQSHSVPANLEKLPLSALLAQVLLAFALDFEAASELSLPLCANALRLLGENPLPIRGLHDMAGISKEAMKVSLGFLVRNSHASTGRAPGTRGPAVRLTSKGLATRDLYQTRVKEIEATWKKRFGSASLVELRESLADLVHDGSPSASHLYQGLTPIPGNWRGPVKGLPWYPMVLHRGGYPDGA
jgi:hypothetical protein